MLPRKNFYSGQSKVDLAGGGLAVRMRGSMFLFVVIVFGLVTNTTQQDATGKKIGKIKAPTPKTPNTIINDVTGEELVHIIDEHEHVAILFYDKLDKKTQKVFTEMEDMETEDLDVEIVR